MDGLKGQSVLVTGGGRGLGAAIGEALAREGARVFVADRDEARAQACAERLCVDGHDVEAIALDVGAETDIARAMALVDERCGRLDTVVNNAAIDVTMPIEELTTADFDRVLQTNLRGPFLVARAAVAYMRPRGSGNIVNIAST